MPQNSETIYSGNHLKVLLVDDEDHFREAMKKQLTDRGYDVLDVKTTKDAVTVVRHRWPEVIILDQTMPGMDGTRTLSDIKRILPETQVILLTSYNGRDAAAKKEKPDVFRYMTKPCGVEELITTIEAARQQWISLTKNPQAGEKTSQRARNWFIGSHNSRPGVILIGAILFALILMMPVSPRLDTLITSPKKGLIGDTMAGYAYYRQLASGETVAEYYAKKTDYRQGTGRKDLKICQLPDNAGKAAFRIKAMAGTLVVAILFWATGAIPVGITALLAGVLMTLFNVLPPNEVARAFLRDAVIFIFGILVISGAIVKTGLDRRIGAFLLGTGNQLWKFTFIFGPLLAITASFLSRHAVVALFIPLLMAAYTGIIRNAGLKKDKNLAVMFILMVCFTANTGGVGSPSAGGHNAVMLGMLTDYGTAPSFFQWLQYGLPFVPVMALVIGIYFFVIFRGRIHAGSMNFMAECCLKRNKAAKMTRDEYKTATVLVLLLLLLVAGSSRFGLGAPVILAVVALNIAGVIKWQDVSRIHWDMVLMYAGACAMGTGLAVTGAALWITDSVIGLLPEAAKSETGLAISSSLIAGITTNFMSDAATVAAAGPFTLSMAAASGTHCWISGLATAFASSFSHALVIATPGNAIAYSLARDHATGEQLVTMKDFFIHGTIVLLLSFLVLWGWVFFGYWKWIGFPEM